MEGLRNFSEKKQEAEEIVIDTMPDTVQELPSEVTATVEPPVENIVPSVEETVAAPEKVVESAVENAPTPEPTKEVAQEIDESSILKYLSEKQGKEIGSIDELFKEPQGSPLESNPQLKALAEWSDKTGRPLEDWVNFTKDYDSMSDMDIARENLLLTYPNLTESEVKLELDNFIADEDFDSEVDMAKKSLELKKFSTDGRKKLNDMKLTFGKPVEGSKNLTTEQEEAINLATDYKNQYATLKQEQESYTNSIKSSLQEMQSIPLKLSDDLTIQYNLTDEDRRAVPDMIQNAPHWKNEDGSWNHSAVSRDAAMIKNMPTILDLAFKQGMALGLEEANKAEGNITLDSRPSIDNPDKTDIVVEGAEYMGKKQGTQLRFRKK